MKYMAKGINIEEQIADEKLDRVSGGYSTHLGPIVPQLPIDILPRDKKDEPRDGGATGGW